MGLLALYSESAGREGATAFQRHVVRLGVGTVPFLVFLLVPPAFWRRISWLLYSLNLALLSLVLVAGSRAGGAQRWLQIGPLEFQPSEMSKLLTVLTLAAYFANSPDRARSLGGFSISFLHILPPMALVFLQPHLGGALVLFVMWLAVCVYAGVRWRYLVVALVLLVGALGSALSVPGLLREYHKDRVKALFVDDSQGKDYQQMRAGIAFGAGGLVGVGFLRGEQKAGRFIPEQHTDFVSTIIGEEAGLVGMSLLLGAFALYFFRGWLIAYRAATLYARLLAVGVLSVLSFHMVVNLGMNLQILPVVGLWLPFLSYGGTALWLALASTGLLLRLGTETGPGLQER
jgi:rod shape determining protein RodA